MNSAEDRIDQAIKLLKRAGASSPHRAAIAELARHWAQFYSSLERSYTPSPMLARKLGRYVQWYARAWSLLPKSAQSLAPRPESIDPSFSQLALDSLSEVRARARATGTSIETSAKRLIQGSASVVFAALGAIAVWWYLTRGKA